MVGCERNIVQIAVGTVVGNFCLPIAEALAVEIEGVGVEGDFSIKSCFYID